MTVSEYIEKNHARLVEYCRPILRCSVEDVEDCIQSVWLRTSKYKPNVADANIRAYCVSSILKDFNRKKQSAYERYRSDANVIVSTTETPETMLMNLQFKNAVAQLADKETKMSKIFRMRYIDGMSGEEISKKLGINKETLRSHIKVSKKLGKFDSLVQDHAYFISRNEVLAAEEEHD